MVNFWINQESIEIMDVRLPDTGCNILNSATSFYNYSDDTRTRETYIIYDGQAHKTGETYNQYGYSYTGTCMETGDLVYKPELEIYFIHIALAVFVGICGLILFIFRGRKSGI